MNSILLALKNTIQQLFISSERGRLFGGLVVVPALFIGFYLLVFCPDEYQSIAVVTVDESGAVQADAGLLQSLVMNGSGSVGDEQILQAFVISPDLLQALEEKLALRKHYSQSWDFLFGLGSNTSLEDFIDFYRTKVVIKRDVDSGLLEISVRAYTAVFAKQLADEILVHSEAFINRSSNNIANREMDFALKEIERSQALLKKAKNALLLFQDENLLVSPDSEGQSLISIVYEMEAELAKVQAELGQASQFLNSDAPKVVALNGRIGALQQEIKGQKQRLIGSTGATGSEQMNRLNVEFQELNMDVETAMSLYTSALGAYEMARIQASKQLKHLVVASRPYHPEKSTYPKRLYWWLTSIIVLFAVFGIVSIISSSIKEHRD